MSVIVIVILMRMSVLSVIGKMIIKRIAYLRSASSHTMGTCVSSTPSFVCMCLRVCVFCVCVILSSIRLSADICLDVMSSIYVWPHGADL